ncbi:transposase family protein [Runella sp.]|uniref:transposase family protein n=1 Tax=Runella sp. TaxID=1960881 RepID=UPI003D118418
MGKKYYRYHTLEGRKRAFPSYNEHGNSELPGTSTKLFFLLNYLKSNNLQQHQAANFGISQSKVSRASSILLMVLNQTLKRLSLSISVPMRQTV